MLTTRLWMGTLLVLLTAGMLIADQWLAPWYPFLFAFILGLSLLACSELIELLGPNRSVQKPIAYSGVGLLGVANWLSYDFKRFHDPWYTILGVFVLLVMATFVLEMVAFRPTANTESASIERMSRTVWILAYLGVLPCFLAQLRWLYPTGQPEYGSVALALVIFVPKSCDIGAYCTGRLLGRHPMTPVLSPKKTWEGAAGGLVLAILVAIGIDRLGPVSPLGENTLQEIAFGLTLAVAGMLGDLAESLIKRTCSRKDASATVPGFGGVLDVVDSVLFAAPVGYFWLKGVPNQ